MQRSVIPRYNRTVLTKAMERKSAPVLVCLSEQSAVTLRQVSEKTHVPGEILAVEAIRKGMELLARC